MGEVTSCGIDSARPGSGRQQTLKNSIHCNGIGLHGGRKVSMWLHPADVDAGIVFRRTDLHAAETEVRASFENVCDTRLCTALSNDEGVTVATVEHLMAALSGCEIDNAEIELDGPEVPIMDGSSEPFVFLIECAGTEVQDAARREIRILKPIMAHAGDATAKLEPANELSFELSIDFESRAIGRQAMHATMCADLFKSEICRARTFGFLEDVEAMREAGLALGGSLDNAVVVSGDRVLNDGGLRYDDEFVRHKILDSLGDLYLAGAPILGHFTGHRTGHYLNNKLIRTLFSDDSAWAYARSDEAPFPLENRLPERAAALA